MSLGPELPPPQTMAPPAPPPPETPAPGWYPDPEHRSMWRWWDGQRWFGTPQAQPLTTRFGGVGAGPFIVAVLLPLGGVIWGIVLLARNQIGPGLAVIGTSGLAFVVYLYLLTAMHYGS